MRIRFKFIILIISIFIAQNIGAMVFDNRFLPLYFKPFIYQASAASEFRVQPLFMRGERGVGNVNDQLDGRKLGIPDIYGSYDLISLDKALQLADITQDSLIRPDLRLEGNLPFKRPSRIDAQGSAFYYQQALTDYLSLGTDFLFLHINSRYEFRLPKNNNFQFGDSFELFDTKARIHRHLGVTPPLSSQIAFGDLDVYLRIFAGWDYTCKFRKILGAFKLGMIAPTATDFFSQNRRSVNNPAAIPLGGYGHWGIYGGLELDFELKEDLDASVYFRAIKRFKRTSIERMPTLAGEPLNYGAIIGPVQRDPGWTFVINPVVNFHGIQNGLGFRIMYTGVAHLKDSFIDKRNNCKPSQANNTSLADISIDSPKCQVDFARLAELSEWGMEHVTLCAFYDFSYFEVCPKYRPTLAVYWDLPFNGLFEKNVPRTNVLSLAFEMSF